MTNKTCFVIQPFSRFYENRFDIVYSRAIESAGLIPCRSGGPDTEDIIVYIKNSIREAHICFADITEDNPNVFYEVCYADTLGKPLIMVCNERIRNAKELPTDIKGRNVLFYDGEKIDFEPLYRNGIIKDIADLAKARMKKADTTPRPSNSDNRGLVSDMSLPIADHQTKDFGNKNMDN